MADQAISTDTGLSGADERARDHAGPYGPRPKRISLARAFLKDTPILILDEPTSAVDTQTEALIMEALERLVVGRTTFIIAHRLSTIRNADKVLVLQDGAVAAFGTHSELLGRRGIYARLLELHRGKLTMAG